ncbi:MAG TPA: hypothetical protein ENF80_04215 [Thermofilum sp.]|nr:hypothetical protein [Thermofilum sp.]
MSKSLSVLGLDGMSWSYLTKLISNGTMPYLSKLIQRSFTAELTCIPPVTPPSWTSIMTGVNPGKHGIFGFFYYERSTWKQRLYTTFDLEHPRVHEMLSMNGLKSIVFNPMPDYPLLRVRNAEVVSNLFFTPKVVSQPEGIYKKYFGDEDPRKIVKSVSCEALSECQRVLEIYFEAIIKALKERYMLLWINLNMPDIIFHRCPQVLKEDRVFTEERKLFELLDKLIEELDKNTDSLMIVSDHGFARYDKIVSINDILLRHGYARSASIRRTKEIGEYRIDEGMVNIKNVKQIRIPPLVYSTVKRLKLRSLARKLLSIYGKITRKKVTVATSRWVDVDGSIAFLPDHYAFGVYVKDERYAEEILKVLKSYNQIDAHLSRDFYHGPFIHRAPDVVVLPRFDLGYWIHGNNITGMVVAGGEYYAHHPLGILVIRDEGLMHIKDQNEVRSVPNHVTGWLALHILNQPLPRSRDHYWPLEKRLYRKPLETNYLARWRVLSKMRRLRCGKP